jgi:tetratricopeptide (TPR) repeat protein
MPIGRDTDPSPLVSGAIPPQARCFIPRAETGPGALDARPLGQWLVLAAPAPGSPGPAVARLDGTGKTQLAAHLARNWLGGSGGGLLAWVTAASRDSMVSGYALAAECAGTAVAHDPEASATRFLTWLAQTSRPWLVVLDGLAAPAELDGLWPDGPAGRVLVTAVDDAVAGGAGNREVFPVGMYTSREALAYLTARLSGDPEQRLGAADLAHELGGDPLAMAHAGAAISCTEMTCRQYRDMFAQRRDELAKAAGVRPPARAVTWGLSLECAEGACPGGTPQPCLALAALLGSHGIPDAIFSARAVAEFIGEVADPARIQPALHGLHEAGLISIDPSGASWLVRVHPEMRTAIMAAMPQSLRERAAGAAARALLEVWPGDAEQSPLAGALRACAASLEDAAADVLWAGGWHGVMFRTGRSLEAAQLRWPAVSHWRAVARASERLLGSGHPDTLLAATRLAGAGLTAGLGTEAVALHQRALSAHATHLGPDHPRTVAARAGLGTALLAAGRPAEAVTALESVPAAGLDYWPDGVDPMAVQDSLLAAYLAAGQHRDAIKLAARLLAEREKAHGPDHPGTFGARRELARASGAAGKAKDAITHGQRALADAERVLGADHPDTVDAVSVLASAYHAARRLKDALPLYERALADRERAQGPAGPETIGARGNLASALHSAGRMASALELYEQTRTDCQRVLGADHPDTLAARANLAHAYYAMGRLTEADALLRAALADCMRVLAPGDPLTEAVRDSLDAVSRG